MATIVRGASDLSRPPVASLQFAAKCTPSSVHFAAGLPARGRATVLRRLPGVRGAAQVVASAVGSQGDGNVKTVESRAEFESFLEAAGDRLVVLDISTKTCGPCKFIYPKVVQLSLEYTDVVFLKIMGDLSADTRALMREWGVRAVPSFRFYRNGQMVHTHHGAKEEDLRKNVKLYATQPVPV